MNLFQSAEDFQKNHPLLATGVVPVKKYNEDLTAEERKQRRSVDDVPLWDVLCSCRDGNRQAQLKVRIASRAEPEIDPGLILFGGFEASTYPDGARNVVMFTADTFTQAAPPSTQRAASAPPPPSKATASSS